MPRKGESWPPPEPTDLIFPKTHREMFNEILAEQDLRFDREGRRRTAYSLRHTYICLRLMEGADIYQIAKNCRTSVEMIEKYYAAHIKTSLDAAAINIKKRKGKKKSVAGDDPVTGTRKPLRGQRPRRRSSKARPTAGPSQPEG